MITSKNRLTRRTMLRGAGGLAVGLPFLSAMLRPGRSHADETTPLRLVVFYHPGGTLLDKWRPMGSERDFALQPMMASLTPYLDRLVFLQGLDLSVTERSVGHPHSRGMAGILTGERLLPGEFNTNGGNAGFAAGASLDQVIASASTDVRFPSLEVSTGWSTGIAAGGQPHPGNTINYQAPPQPGAFAVPVPPATDPLNTFERIFGTLNGEASENEKELAFSKSVLDGVQEDFKRLMPKLGREDQQKLEAHLALVQKAASGLSQGVSQSCEVPSHVNQTPGYYDDPIADGTSRGDSDGGDMSITTGAKVPEKGKIMTDLLVSALACDLTRVGTMQWSDSEAKFMLGFLKDSSGASLKDHHHGYQHDRGFQPEALELIYKFYTENLAYLLERLAATPDVTGTLLDNTLVLAVSEIQQPENHGQSNMPLILAGANGKLDAHRWLQLPSQPHNNLLASILNLFGIAADGFGHPEFNTGPLSGIFV